MPYAIIATDRPGSAALRAARREAHLAYLAPFTSRILAAGALLEEDGATVIGSLIVLDTEDRGEAEALLAGDPYQRAGLFERVEVARWRKVFFNGERQTE